MEIPAVNFPQTPATHIKQECTDSDLSLMLSDYIQSGIVQTQYSLQLSTHPSYRIKQEPPGGSKELAPSRGVFQKTPIPTADRNRYCSQEDNSVKSRDLPRYSVVQSETHHEPTKYEMISMEKAKPEHKPEPLPLSNNIFYKTTAVSSHLKQGDKSNASLTPSFGKVLNPDVQLENTSSELMDQDYKDTVVMLSDYAQSEFSDLKLNFFSEDRCMLSGVVDETGAGSLDSVSASTSSESICTSFRQGLDTKAGSNKVYGTSESRHNTKSGREHLKRPSALTELAPLEHKRMKKSDGFHTIDFELSEGNEDISRDRDWAVPPGSKSGNPCRGIENAEVDIRSTNGYIRSTSGSIRNISAVSTSGELKTGAVTPQWQPNLNTGPPVQTCPIPSSGLSQQQVSERFHFLTKWKSSPDHEHHRGPSSQPFIRDKVNTTSGPDAIPSDHTAADSTVTVVVENDGNKDNPVNEDWSKPRKEEERPSSAPILSIREPKRAKHFSRLTTEEIEELKKLPEDGGEDTLEPVFRVRCDMCSWAFRDLNSLVTHMSQQHDTSLEKPFRCELCHKSVEGRDHFVVQHMLMGRICTVCGLSARRMNVHMGCHNNPYGCRTCGKRFINARAIKEHLNEFENHIPENKCTHCSLIIRMSEFTKHVNYHIHGFPYKCDICPYECSTPSALAVHKIIHTGKKEKKCPHCDLWFLDNDRVKGHIQGVHTAKSFLCAICGSSYSFARQLRDHMLTHEEGKFKCEICGKEFHKKSRLRRHTAYKHQSRPGAQCAICGKMTRSKGALSEHMDVHRDEMPHECPVCKKKFKRRHNMTSHLRTHGEDRKYKCEVCGDGFKWAHNLRNHLKTHNNGEN